MSKSIALRTNNVKATNDARELKALLDAILADLASLRTAINAHTHSGITAGAGTSGAANAGTAAALTLLA